MGNYTPVLLNAVERMLSNTAYLSNSGLSNARHPDTIAWDALLDQCANVTVMAPDPDDLDPLPPFDPIMKPTYPNYPIMLGLAANQSFINPDPNPGGGLREWIGQILASDNRKFALHMQAGFAHRKQLNAAINSTANGNTVASSSFTSMDELTTGNISLVATDPAAFGQDLINTGRLLNFAEVDNYGTVDSLFKVLAGTNMLETLRDEFAATGTDINALTAQVLDTGTLPLKSQKIVYEVAKTITGKKLTDILLVLAIGTAGIATLADLVNTEKLFPLSRDTLRGMNAGTPELIYTSTGVQSWISQVSTTQASVMSPDIAQANKVFSWALQQIKKIYDLDAVTLGEQALEVELNTGLTSIENQTQPLDSGVQASLDSTFALGTGANNEYQLEDIFGSIISSVVYETAVNGLISNPGNASDVAAINAQITKDVSFFTEIGIYNGNPPTTFDAGPQGGFVTRVTRTTALDLSQQLYSWAEDEDIAEFLLKVIKTGAGGDAIDAALREGRNQSRLRSAGVGSDLQIEDTPI